MSPRLRLLPLVLASLSPLAAGCSGKSSAGTNDQASTQAPACPPLDTDIQSLDDFVSLDSGALNALFNSDTATCLTKASKIPQGDFDGIPLCRVDVLPTYDQLPQGVKDVAGARIAIDTLRASETVDNALASKIWHGKQFYPTMDYPTEADPGLTADDKATLCIPGHADKCGAVLNFIDILADSTGPTVNRSANAIDFIDPANSYLVLNYAGSTSGVRGGFLLRDISVELIRHVYDSVRLVNAEQGIYLGMAWLVDTPGKYEPNTPNTVPSCYFALKRK